MQRISILTGEMEHVNPEKNPITALGSQIVQSELTNLSLQIENEGIGQQLVDLDLRLLQGGM